MSRKRTLSRTLLHIGRHNSWLRKRFLQTSLLAQFGGGVKAAWFTKA